MLHLILQYSLSIGANCWGNYSKFHIPVYLGQDTSPCSVNLSSLPSRHNRRCPTCTIILNYIVLEHQLCKILTKFIWSLEVALAFIAQALQCMMFDSATEQMNVNWQVGHHFVDQLPMITAIFEKSEWLLCSVFSDVYYSVIIIIIPWHNCVVSLANAACELWTARTWMIVKSKLTAMFATIGCKFYMEQLHDDGTWHAMYAWFSLLLSFLNFSGDNWCFISSELILYQWWCAAAGSGDGSGNDGLHRLIPVILHRSIAPYCQLIFDVCILHTWLWLQYCCRNR